MDHFDPHLGRVDFCRDGVATLKDRGQHQALNRDFRIVTGIHARNHDRDVADQRIAQGCVFGFCHGANPVWKHLNTAGDIKVVGKQRPEVINFVLCCVFAVQHRHIHFIMHHTIATMLPMVFGHMRHVIAPAQSLHHQRSAIDNCPA